jgi:hypothetical protein
MSNCQKYKGLCLFPKQFITSPTPQTESKKIKTKEKYMR